MKMGILFLFVLLISLGLSTSNQCSIGGASTDFRNIYDITRGVIFTRTTTNIQSIEDYAFSQQLNYGPYFTLTLVDSQFVIETTNAFEYYEENETLLTVAVTATFSCLNGPSEFFVLIITITDTNNNAPRFIPSDEFTYTVPTPFPAGLTISGCFDGITVRDIDLTTQRIDFEIEENPYFEIVYDEISSTTQREFVGILRSTTFIRTLLEPITLKITATDVDLTGDPPLTAVATVTFKGEATFTLPEDPVFSEPFYFANYTKDHQVILLEPISLQSGFHDFVNFTLHGDFSDNFVLVVTGDQVTIQNRIPLETYILRETQIILVIRAEREETSGDRATVILQLPEAIPLQFEQSSYRGTVRNNILQIAVLSLLQDYEGELVNTEVLGEHSQFFTTSILGFNSIQLTMNGLPASVIAENNIISLEVVASSNFNVASTIVILEIIRDDNPLFSSPLYTGSYETETGLTLEPIILTQGYDETVVSLSGDHLNYFEATREGAVVTIRNTTSIPPSIFHQRHILLTLHATRPLSVGASTAIVITLPAGVQLEFEQSNYRGTIKNNILQELVLPLIQGYEGGVVNSEVLGEYSHFFTTSIQGNLIQLTMNELPASVVAENHIISLEVVASSTFSRARTIVILEIIREDNVTPVFSSPLYTGSYETETGLTLEPIILTQGYDETIALSLSGDHSNYFEATREGAVVTIRNTTSIPPSIFNQQHILLTLHATRPLTVGASTAIVITLPAGVQLEFEQSNYHGTIKNNILQELVLPLIQGYEGGVVYSEVLGEYSQFFTTSNQGNLIQLTMSELPVSVIAENNIISLEVLASSAFSRARTIVILEIIREDNVTPVFSSPLYTGSYETETGLTLEPIILTQGYDETIVLSLSGDHSNYFEATREGAVVTIRNTTSIPPSIFNQQHILLTLHATRPLTVGARTAIVITLPAGVQLEFEQTNYRGTIKNNILQELVLPLIQGYEGGVVNSEVLGEYSQFFTTSNLGNLIQLTMTELPVSVIAENNIISLEVVASSAFSRARTIVILEIIREENVTPVFSAPLYTGSYETETGLTLEPIILTQGYDETIVLSLSGDHSNYFEATREGAVVTIRNTTSIPPSIFNQQHILLTLHATRPLTVGASTAIVITLPAGVPLEFEQSSYRGTIKNNILQELVLPLVQGYEGGVVTAIVLGEHSQFFTTSIQENSIQLIMNELPANVIAENNIISLEVVAFSNFSRASTVVILELIRNDDHVTLVFSSPLYTGSYETETGLTLEPIIFTQGYDETIVLSLAGDHSHYFEATHEGAVVTIRNTTSIPPSIFNQQHILLTLHATRPLTVGASTAIVITLPAGFLLEFEQSNYRGTIKNNILQELVLPLIPGYEGEVVNTEVFGEYSQFFNTNIIGNLIELKMNDIPNSVIALNNFISLEVVASSNFNTASTIVILEIVRDDHVVPIFSSPLYKGSYETETGLTIEPIIFTQGYDETVELSLSGDHSNYFEATREGAVVTIRNTTSIPPSIFNQQHILLFLQATRPQTLGASTAIVITLPAGVSLEFEQSNYLGIIKNNNLQELILSLTPGYDGEIVNTEVLGEYSQFFNTAILGNSIELIMNGIPDSVIALNNIISLEIVAFSNFSRASTIVILEIVRDDHVIPIFSSPLHTGSYETETGLILDPIMLIQGFDETTELSLSGDHSSYFVATRDGVFVIISNTTSIPPSIFNQQYILLFLHATRPQTVGASTAIFITLPAGVPLEFEQSSYLGTIRNNMLQELVLSLTQDYEGEIVNTEVLGEYSQFFGTSTIGNSIQLTMINEIPDGVIAANNIISLEVVAFSNLSRASTIVILNIVQNIIMTPLFSSPLYTGSYETETGLTLEPIIFTQGYDETIILSLSGDHSSYFEATREGAVVTIRNTSSIPPSIFNQQHILLTLHATRPLTVGASTVIVIALPAGSQGENDVSFERLVYEGTIQLSSIQHESIIILNHDGVNLLLYGQYASLFVASVVDGEVSIRAANEVLTLPGEVTRVVLELHAGDARAVLLLTVIDSEVPVLPMVTFSSDVYVLNVEDTQTGLIGMVLATADNKEDVTYSLNINDEHLLARISINQKGELHLFAPANSGVYEFEVIATTVMSRATGTAKVHMTVQAISIEDDRIYVPPLIILNRTEEEPHFGLVPLPSGAEGCQYTLNNRGPLDQGWLYVDENGLHTTSIDREHESIAFMTLSQIQVELILTCDSDNVSLKKRSKRNSWLGPYDYNANTWILTESIPYNPRRSLVNLIVEDINDNYPIFVGKENEPIAVGYPVYELEERILPRSLAELQATDADIGENAALMYWSSEEALAVSATTGFVHVRTGAQLQNDQILIVHATDQNGEGLTGNIQILVKLLSADNIAVVTVENAFLDDEKSILTDLSMAIGYELRVLRSVVISDTQNQNRMSRNTLDTSASGASLLLYVYGLVDRDPVNVNRLTEDINNNAGVANVINTVSLEDHLVPVEIIVTDRDIGFFVATIVLSALLVLIIVLTTIWFCLKRRKNNNYDEFSDKNSLTSGTDSIDQVSKPETPKSRLNIEELKKSEQRLQDRLNTPFETVSVEAMPPKKETSIDDIADLLSPESNIPIVIQSVEKIKDAEETDDDEFGEKVEARRKSVVTFNENVEKIIHLQNDTDSVGSTSVGYEVFKL